MTSKNRNSTADFAASSRLPTSRIGVIARGLREPAHHHANPIRIASRTKKMIEIGDRYRNAIEPRSFHSFVSRLTKRVDTHE
jgi:hypothetical protein